MDTKKLEQTLETLGACEFARTWAKGKTLEEAHRQLHRPDWLLWLTGRLATRLRELGREQEADALRRRMVMAACACARTVLGHVQPGETRPLAAIESAERWARGEPGVTSAEVDSASDAAARAAYVAARATVAAYAASDAAAYAAAAALNPDAAYVAARAAYSAADATADGAVDAAFAAARDSARAELATIVKERLPLDVVEQALTALDQ